MAGPKDEEPFTEPLAQILDARTWDEVASPVREITAADGRTVKVGPYQEPTTDERARREAAFREWEANSKASPPKRVADL